MNCTHSFNEALSDGRGVRTALQVLQEVAEETHKHTPVNVGFGRQQLGFIISFKWMSFGAEQLTPVREGRLM